MASMEEDDDFYISSIKQLYGQEEDYINTYFINMDNNELAKFEESIQILAKSDDKRTDFYNKLLKLIKDEPIRRMRPSRNNRARGGSKKTRKHKTRKHKTRTRKHKTRTRKHKTRTRKHKSRTRKHKTRKP